MTEKKIVTNTGSLSPKPSEFLNNGYQTSTEKGYQSTGSAGAPSNPQWLSPEAALELLQSAEPTANANDGIKQREVRGLLDRYGELSPDLEVLARERAEELGATYARIRTITKGKRSIVHPQMPMDLLGLLILTPG